MYTFASIVILSLATVAIAQRQQLQQSTTPVPILRQVNTHNDDGSYTYGYEAADGSYKIETKAATGEVRGKYGYYDDAGTLREIEYGASRNGFAPSGTGIQVPEVPIGPNNIRSDNPEDYDDGQYRPGPDEAGYRPSAQQQHVRTAPARLSNARQFNFPAQQQQRQQQPQPQQQKFQPQQYQQQQQPQPQVQQQQYYEPEPQQPAYRPISLPSGTFQGHPARNINLNSGSYSIQY